MPGLLIHGARQVLTLRGANCPRRGAALRNLSIIEDGSILIEDGKIRDVGPTRRIENLAAAKAAHQISARGRVVMPGFVDSSLKLIGGADAAACARMVRQTPAWRMTEDGALLLRRCLRYGTTTIEVKSGSGLDETAALKVLRVVAALVKAQPIRLLSTFCGATSAPSGDWSAYIELLASRVLPALKAKELVNFVLVDGNSPCDAMAEAVHRAGLGLKIAAESGAVLGAVHRAHTVEHLEGINDADVTRLAESSAIAALMPGFGFHSERRGYAPARDLIARGMAVALASGYDRVLNPSFSMPMAIELACRKLGMAPSEAIVAATINGAHAVGLGATTGSLEPGKDADILVLETPDYRDLACETGVNPVDITIVRGDIACQNSVTYGAAAG